MIVGIVSAVVTGITMGIAWCFSTASASLVSAVVTGITMVITWCFCTASTSLCSSWCGSDKPSTPPSTASGRKRSVLLLAFSVIVSLVFQYAVAPNVGNIPWQYLSDSWTSGCGDGMSEELAEVCSGNAGVYRAASAAFTFFSILGIAAKCRPTSNREAWPAKYVLFIFLCVCTAFIPNDPVFVPFFLWIARVGSVIFVLLQQIILVDIAYNWNEAWVNHSEQAELEEGPGKGNKWLGAILASCGILYIASFAGIIIMFIHFGGCTTNDIFISITLVMSVLCTVVQLVMSETGSLLISACITIYATYMCGAAVSKNPDATCNPKLGEKSIWSIVIGLLIAFVSMIWTGWSYTADKRLGGAGIPEDDVYDRGDDEKAKVAGIVLGDKTPSYGAADTPLAAVLTTSTSTSFSGPWKLNAVLALVCCWYAMILTGWGAIEKRGDIPNPDAGEISMYMLISSQWLALLLYLWTLVAPSLFPDRDFS